MKSHRGLTLVELLTVVSIIGVLAAIAYPTYTQQAIKGRRAAAKATLLEVLQHEERFYSQNNRFTASMEDLGFGAGPTYYNDSRSHTISLAAGPSGNILTSVTISATPVAADTKCGILRLSSNMARAATGTQPATCW